MKKYLPLFCLLFLAVFVYLNQSVKATSTEQELRDKFQEKLIEASGTTDMPDFKDPKNFPWRDTVQEMISLALVKIGLPPSTPDWSLPTDDKWYTSLNSTGFTIQTLPSRDNPLNSCNYQGAYISSNAIFAKAKVELPSGQILYGAGNCEYLNLAIPSGQVIPSGTNLNVEVQYLWWNSINTKTFSFIVQ